jgi:excinuclease ABC subunit C
MGKEIIKDFLLNNKNIINSAGIYKMYNADNEIIYIGKAKVLAKRIESYLKPKDNKTQALISKIAKIEVLTTASENDALLLEYSMIKKHKPKYNILLKDDKMLPEIAIDITHPFPAIKVTRKRTNKDYLYFGPFPRSDLFLKISEITRKIFKIRDCKDTIFRNRTRPCIQYDIGQCSGPCVNIVSKQQYAEQIKQAVDFLKGSYRKIICQYKKDMKYFAEKMEFEKAAITRDKIKTIASVSNFLVSSRYHNVDVVGFAREESIGVVAVTFIRNSLNFGTETFRLENITQDDSDYEIINYFIKNFYIKKQKPDAIILDEKYRKCQIK